MDSNSPNPVVTRGLLLASASIGNRSLTDLPYGAVEIYLTGYTHPSLYIFQLKFADDEATYQVNSDDLFQIGFVIKFEDSGLVLVSNRYTKQKFYCVFDPHFKREFIKDNTEQNNESEPVQSTKFSPTEDSAFSVITG